MARRGPPAKVTDLPSAINHHWTKALTASANGRFLYVGIGSNSNITERGMPAEQDRARIWRSTLRLAVIGNTLTDCAIRRR